MTALSLEQFLLSLPYDAQPAALKALEMKGKNISSLPSPLNFLKSLRKVDLSNNALTDLSALATLPPTVTQLDLSHNRIKCIEPLKSLTALVVLNVSHNTLKTLAIPSCGPPAARSSEGKKGKEPTGKGKDSANATATEGFCASLGALIASNNNLQDVEWLTNLPNLNTLVLSHNKTIGQKTDVSARLFEILSSTVTKVKKLSLTDCGIQAIPATTCLAHVTEWRLARNELSEFPKLEEPTLCQPLKILDISYNHFCSLESLKLFWFLEQLSLTGNPVLDDFKGEGASSEGVKLNETVAFRSMVSALFHRLKLVDGKPFACMSKDEVRKARKELAKRRGATTEDDDTGKCETEEPTTAAKTKKGTSADSRAQRKRPRMAAEEVDAETERLEAEGKVLDAPDIEEKPTVNVVRKAAVVKVSDRSKALATAERLKQLSNAGGSSAPSAGW